MAKLKPKTKKEFKPIFSRHADINKMAFMNWRMDDSQLISLINIGEGFFESALLLANACCRSNKHKRSDILIFPIFANANHGIELYLKSINWILNQLLNKPRKIEGGHNIDLIYKTVKAKIKEFGGKEETKNFDDATANLNEYIKELYLKNSANAKNDKMDFSRYPFGTDYSDHFYVDQWLSGKPTPAAEVDMPNFVKRFKEIRKNLDLYCEYLYYVHLKKEELDEYPLDFK